MHEHACPHSSHTLNNVQLLNNKILYAVYMFSFNVYLNMAKINSTYFLFIPLILIRSYGTPLTIDKYYELKKSSDDN